ncbi:HNH endonuclease [Arthrobacter sp. I2-34]|uniref:HNH endonuclease n=1 Tax=Arthrobacter hankyongi TaxID=2904801 RepID=A0ABS9LD77_9MICC|nr:HNH endonuclease signature motif containing protein [Arthrobacter hankyongi]MCG2624568.1 HNH endonuclease [Arthrobacter hankyongi]
MAAEVWEPDPDEWEDPLEDPGLPDGGLPPDPGPDRPSSAGVWVNIVPMLPDPDEDWVDGDDDEDPDPFRIPVDRAPARAPLNAAPQQLLALLAGLEPAGLVYEEAADALVMVRRSRSFLDAWEARLLGRMQAAAEQEQPCAGEPEDCTLAAGARTERLASASVAEEAARLLRIPGGQASTLLEDARRLTSELTPTLRALAGGQLTGAQAQVILAESRFLPASARPAFEAELLTDAHTMTRPALICRARKLREQLHPETIAARRTKAEADRCVELRPLEDGMAWLGLYTTAEKAVAAFNRIQGTAVALQGPGESRTLTQLQVDVAADLLLSAPCAAGPAGGSDSGITAQVMITVPALTLLGADDTPAELEGYGPLPAEVARRLAGDAPSFTRLLTDPVSGAVLAMDRRQYRPTKAQRRFLRGRDRTCRFPGCRRSVRSCDLDHTLAWSRGGRTDADNLAYLCPRHHALKTAGLWTARQPEAGTVCWTSPAGRTYTDHPEPLAATPPARFPALLDPLMQPLLEPRPERCGTQESGGPPGADPDREGPAPF